MTTKFAENRYRGTLDSLLEGFQIIGTDWTYLYVNPAAASHGRSSPEDLHGRKMWEVYPGIEKTPLFAMLQRCMAERTTAALENQFDYPDGHQAWFELRIEPVPEGLCIHSFNIQARWEAQESLQRLNAELEARVAARTRDIETVNAELEAFAFSVSHDLTTPLRHIVGFGDLLKQDAATRMNDEDKDSLFRITRAAERMTGMIDALLEFSRLGRNPLQKEACNFSEIVRLAQADLEPELEGRDIVWTVPALPQVQADPDLMRLVMVNLLSNSLKYTRGRAPAEISLGTHRHKETGEFVVWVRDNGVGFEMRNVDRLFGVFQRLHRDTDFEGTGIGLANVRRIVVRHGGRVWAEGAVGEGATFYMALP